MKSGMKHLIEAFYRSITDGAPLPISYRDILLTARIMDTIFGQLSGSGIHEQASGGTHIEGVSVHAPEMARS
jgi:hypothetical protein